MCFQMNKQESLHFGRLKFWFFFIFVKQKVVVHIGVINYLNNCQVTFIDERDIFHPFWSPHTICCTSDLEKLFENNENIDTLCFLTLG
jgi:hypothetical protein